MVAVVSWEEEVAYRSLVDVVTRGEKGRLVIFFGPEIG